MNFPKELLYSKSHEWIQMIDETTAKVGLTDFAQDALGDIVYINLPEIEDEVIAGDPISDVESVKAVSDIYSPFTGVITDINEDVLDAPEKINEDPYSAWLFIISDITEKEELLSAEDYEIVCNEEA